MFGPRNIKSLAYFEVQGGKKITIFWKCKDKKSFPDFFRENYSSMYFRKK